MCGLPPYRARARPRYAGCTAPVRRPRHRVPRPVPPLPTRRTPCPTFHRQHPVSTPSAPRPQYRAQGDDRTIAVLTHLSGLIGALVSVGWLGFVGPLVVWLVHRDKNAFLRATSAGSFNFNLSMWLLNVVAWVCLFTVILIPVAIVLWILAAVLLVVCHVLAVLKANKGEVYRYPLQLPVLQ